MRHLSRRQVVVLVIFAVWALLLVVGLFGGSVAGLPRVLTTTAGVVALIAVFWCVPGGFFYALARERRQGVIRAKGMGGLAIRWRWRFAISSAWTLFLGTALLVPSARATAELRVGGAVIFVWGLLALAVAALAFRTKSWMGDGNRSR